MPNGVTKIAMVVLIAVVAAFGVLYLYAQRFYGGGYPSTLPKSPQQPIAFSHKLHAGKYQIDCLYCHSRAEKTPLAGVPTVKKCQQCHAAQPDTGFEGEAAAIAEHWRDKTPIRWVRVHDLPDHVYFSHRVHLAAEIECSTCHGDVTRMDRIERVEKLSMGWCIDCHKQRQASIECSICHQ